MLVLRQTDSARNVWPHLGLLKLFACPRSLASVHFDEEKPHPFRAMLRASRSMLWFATSASGAFPQLPMNRMAAGVCFAAAFNRID